MGIFASIHDPRLAFSCCDQVLLMREGIVTASLLRSSPGFEDERIRLAGALCHMRGQDAEAMGEKTMIQRRETDA